jgi:hypothetical protein
LLPSVEHQRRVGVPPKCPVVSFVGRFELKMQYIAHDDLEQFSNFLNDLVIGSYRLNGKVEAFSSRYRKPLRVTKGRVAKEKAVHKPLNSVNHNEVPSYFATGLIGDEESNNNRSSSNEVNHPHQVTPETHMGQEAAFAASLTTATPDDNFSISTATTFNIPRRQRSFSLTSCYAMRKPGRRRTSSLGDINEPSSRVLLMDMIAALNDASPDYDFANTKKEQFNDLDLPTALRVINGYLSEMHMNERGETLEKLWSAIDEIVNLKHCEIFQYQPLDDDADTFLWSFHFFFFNKEIHTLCYFTCSAERYCVL